MALLRICGRIWYLLCALGFALVGWKIVPGLFQTMFFLDAFVVLSAFIIAVLTALDIALSGKRKPRDDQ